MVGYPQALGDGLCIGDVAVDFAHARDGVGRGTGKAIDDDGFSRAMVSLRLSPLFARLRHA